MAITWHCLTFDTLSNQQLYALMKLRVDIFIVEQNCPYPELDGRDTQDGVFHLIGLENEKLVAGARLLPAGIKFDTPSIGRVVVHPEHRSTGLGHILMEEALKRAKTHWPEQDIFLSAQQHLEHFYARHGFTPCSDVYLEDNIPHIDMIKKASSQA